MEMTMGTLVTIVLVVAFLVVGIIFLMNIRDTGTKAINGVDRAITKQIQDLFLQSEDRKIVIVPETRTVEIKKGEDSFGFGFFIRNLDSKTATFSYTVAAQEADCGMRLADADELLGLGGGGGTGISIASGDILQDYIFIKFVLSETVPICSIRYKLEVKKEGEIYGTSMVDLVIKSK